MTKLVYCLKLQKQAAALTKPPVPGPLGERIFAEISEEAWRMWISHQTMLINEYRLNLLEPKARTFLWKEMENYFFGQGSEKPPGFTESD